MEVGKSALLALVRLSQEGLMLCQLVVPPLACKVASGNESERKEWQERVTRRLAKAPYVQREGTMVFLGGGVEDK